MRAKLIKPTVNLLVSIAVLSFSLVQPLPAQAASLLVNSTGDALTNDGSCTLREAITNANNDAVTWSDCATGSGADTISFAPGVTTIFLTGSLPDISDSAGLTINGTPADGLVRIEGADIYRPFNVFASGSLTLIGLEIANGRAIGADGGAILNDGTLTLTDSVIDSSYTDQSGGGLYNSATGTATITSSLLTDNGSSLHGGGIYNDGTLTVVNSTLWGNVSYPSVGGGIYNAGSLTLSNSTLASNWKHNLYNAATGTLSMTNTILANSNGDCANDGTITLNDHNLIEWEDLVWDTSCGGTNLVTDDPLTIEHPANNGGPTLTLALTPGSPAIDAGGGSCELVDQRGVTRPQYAGCDLGAFEVNSLLASTTVDITGDTYDGFCTPGDCSLRDAVASVVPGGTVDFDLTYPATITLTTSLITINKDLTLSGPGAANLAVSGGDSIPIFNIKAGSTVNIAYLSLADGRAIGADGGAILNDGTLTLTDSVIDSSYTDQSGGGLYNSATGTATITSSLLTDNGSSLHGGGIYNDGTLTVVNSTLWGNVSYPSVGGGIYNAGSLTLSNSTLASNWKHNLYNAATGTLSMTNTILANSNGDCANDGTITLNDHNLIEWEDLVWDTSCGGTNLVTDDPLTIEHPANNGGPTLTLALTPGSPAIDAGGGSCELVDQRGVTRPQYAGCDLGAFELDNYPPTDISLSNTSIDENQTAGTLVGSLSTTDPDSGDTHSYNLQSGVIGCNSSGNGSFQISGDELQSAVVFDYEIPPTSFNICLRSTDSGGGTYDEQFTIDINDLDDTPPEHTAFLRYNPATSPTAADTLVFQATFSEDVQDVDPTDFAVNGSTTATVSGVAVVDPSTYEVTVSGGDLASFNGAVGLDLAPGQNISDLTGNPLLSSEPAIDEVYLIDNTAPELTSFERSIPAASPTNADSLVFLASFNEDVINLDMSDFAVDGTTTAAITGVVSVNPSTYDITVSGGDLASFNGAVGLDLAAGQDITDTVGNPLPGSEPAVDEIYFLDNIPTDVSSILRQNPPGSPTNLPSVTFRVSFTEDVQNADTSDFDLALSGTATGIINSLITQSVSVYDLVITGVGGNGVLDLNFDPANDIADLGGNSLGASPAIGSEETYLIDTIPPMMVFGAASVPPAEGATLISQPSVLVVEFSETVQSGGGPDAADSLANYLLLKAGPNSVFDTTLADNAAICDAAHTILGDDIKVSLLSASYDPVSSTATLQIDPSFAPLVQGQYRLYLCGAVSIDDQAGNPLNGGTNTAVNFRVITTSSLPKTGYAPHRVTSLPEQLKSQNYSSSDLTLEIPRLGLRTNILSMPQTDGIWNATWLGPNVGWLQGTAFPTWAGNSILTGHVYDATGLPGPFLNLRQLRYGDRIIVNAWGQQYIYEVRGSSLVLPEDTGAAFKHEEFPWLTLITCRGYDEATDSYLFRIVVRAVQVEIR